MTNLNNNENPQENKSQTNSPQKAIVDFILEKIFFITGAFLLLIGLGYSIVEFIKDIKIILLLVFILGLIFIILPYKYKEKLNNFFLIGLQAIGITILYTDTIVSSLLFNVFPLIYSLIIIFGISLLSLILSLINRSNVLMVLSSAGAYLSIVFPDIPLSSYLNKYLIFITLINTFMSLSFYIFKWLEIRLINLIFFIISITIFFGLKGLESQFFPLIILFLLINYILFYLNFVILIPKLKLTDLIYFIFLNLIYWITNTFLIKTFDFSIYLKNIPSNIISFSFSFIFTLFLAFNYQLLNKKKENINILWIFYSMIILFSILTIQTLLNNIYWFIIWLTLSTVYMYIFYLTKNEEYKSISISSYSMFLINILIFYISYWSLDYSRILYLTIVFILNTLMILIMVKSKEINYFAYLNNFKYFPIFFISFIPYLIEPNSLINILNNEQLLSVFNLILFLFFVIYLIYKLTNNLLASLLIGIIAGLPISCIIFFIIYGIWGNLYQLYIINLFFIILLIAINFTKLNEYIENKYIKNEPIFNFLSATINTFIIASIIFPPIEIINSSILGINKFYLFILIYSILSILSLILYNSRPNLLNNFSYYSITIFYSLLILFLLHLIYPLLYFEDYHYIYSQNNYTLFNIRSLSYFSLALNSIIIYYIYSTNENLKNNNFFKMIDKNSILTLSFTLLILIIQEIYDVFFKIKGSEFISNLVVLIIISIYGVILLFLSNKDEKLQYLKDASIISLGLSIIIASRSYFRNVEYFQILLVIMGIYFILFAILFNPRKNKTISYQDNNNE